VSRPGVFERTNGGVLLLDDIATLPLGIQPKLLQVIQEREVRRLGGGASLKVDVWVIAATNEDLAAAVQAGRFRRDLRDRLAQITLEMPPLRDRREDILPLASYLLAEVCQDFGLAPKRLAPQANRALVGHAWPGNVRELANVMLEAAIRFDGEEIDADAVRRVLAGHSPREGAEPGDAMAGTRQGSRASRVARPRRLPDPDRLLATLESCGWNEYRAARELGVPRSTLRYRIKRYGLERRLAGQRSQAARRAVSPEPGGSGAPEGAPVWWETRSIAALRVRLIGGDDLGCGQPGSALGPFIDRVRLLGGEVVRAEPGGLLAVFGLSDTRGAEAACRAAQVGLGLLRAVEREHGLSIAALAVHCRLCVVARWRGGGIVRPEDVSAIEACLDAHGALEPGH
jgi:hypothetical protein